MQANFQLTAAMNLCSLMRLQILFTFGVIMNEQYNFRKQWVCLRVFGLLNCFDIKNKSFAE